MWKCGQGRPSHQQHTKRSPHKCTNAPPRDEFGRRRPPTLHRECVGVGGGRTAASQHCHLAEGGQRVGQLGPQLGGGREDGSSSSGGDCDSSGGGPEVQKIFCRPGTSNLKSARKMGEKLKTSQRKKKTLAPGGTNSQQRLGSSPIHNKKFFDSIIFEPVSARSQLD